VLNSQSLLYPIFILLCILFQPPLFAQNQPFFEDITRAAGIDFKYTLGDFSYENILESSGSGITILDYDGDGDMDIYLLNGVYLPGISDPQGIEFADAKNKLYQNNGDGTFTEVTKRAGIDDNHWSMAAGALDYDGDGDVDIYLVNYGANVFYRNNGDGTFTDITKKLGLTGPETLNGFTKWSVGVAYLDFNNDERTDIMVGNFLAFDPQYVTPGSPGSMPHPDEYKGQASLLYEQQTDGTFREVTSDHGLLYPDSKCMGLTVFDYDGDGDMDIFQGNDHQMNFMFRNDGRGYYTEVGIVSGVAVNDKGSATGSMHGTIGDIDGDGLVDMLVTDLKYGALYRNLGSGVFEDITHRSGVANAFSGKGQWGAAFIDYDNDGDLDIFSANGTAEELILQFPLLLENDGHGNFKDVGRDKGDYFREKRSGRGTAIVDYDDDGDMDIIVSHVDGNSTPVLNRNNLGNTNNWLGVYLVGKTGKTSAIGATLTLETGAKKIVRINQWSTSYLSNNDPRVHFGLGKEDKITSLKIVWPDGQIEHLSDIAVNQYINVKQGKGIYN
jgi:enediyne biosynthesis protein E4